MRKTIAAIFLCAVFITACLYLILNFSFEDDSIPAPAETEKLTCALGDINNQVYPTEIAVTNSYGEYILTVEYSGSITDLHYYFKDYPDIKLDSTFLPLIVSLGRVLIADAVNEHPDNLADYGLDNPRARMQVDYPGKSTELLVGDMDYSGSGFYIKTNESDTVYFTNNPAVFFLDKPFLNIPGKKVTGLESTADIDSLLIENGQEEVEIAAADEGGYIFKGYANSRADQEKVRGFITAMLRLTAEEIAAVYPSEEALEQFGLLEPAARIYITQGNILHDITFSKPGEEWIYIMSGDNPVIYKCRTEDLNIRDFTFFEFMEKPVFKIHEEAESITVTGNGAERIFNKEDAGFKDMYYMVTSISYDYDLKEPVELGAADITVSVLYSDGISEEVQIYLNDSRRYYVKNMDDKVFLTRAQDIDRIGDRN